MDGAEALLEGHGPHGGGGHHLTARLDIRAVGIGAGQVVLDQPHPFQRDPRAHRVEMRRAVSLEAMGEGIHPGACSDRLWHSHGQFRVADHDRGQDFRVEDDLLLMRDRIGQDRGAAHFGAGPCRGRNSHDGCYGGRVGAGPPVADILVIPDGPGLPRHEGHGLAQIKARAAAKGDHPVMPAGLVGGDTSGQVDLGRVGVHVREHRATQTGGLHQIQRRGGDGQAGQTLVRDQQGVPDPRGCTSLGQFGDAARPETDGGGIGPVGAQGHCCFLRW